MWNEEMEIEREKWKGKIHLNVKIFWFIFINRFVTCSTLFYLFFWDNSNISTSNRNTKSKIKINRLFFSFFFSSFISFNLCLPHCTRNRLKWFDLLLSTEHMFFFFAVCSFQFFFRISKFSWISLFFRFLRVPAFWQTFQDWKKIEKNLSIILYISLCLSLISSARQLPFFIHFSR